MTGFKSPYMNKIVNPDLALTTLHAMELRGEFKALVKLAKPDQKPANLKIMEMYSPGLFKARIPCDRITVVAKDSNVISVELREHVSGVM